MTHHTTVSPLSHETDRTALAPEFARVDDEYVLVVVDETSVAGDRSRITYSIRVDPTDGEDGELVLDVERRTFDAPPADRASFTVAISAPGLGDPLRVGALESRLETWFHQHDRPDATGTAPLPMVGREGTASRHQRSTSSATPQ
jgi:hypothetical protein